MSRGREQVAAAIAIDKYKHGVKLSKYEYLKYVIPYLRGKDSGYKTMHWTSLHQRVRNY